jgi:hypothetical protein
MIMQRNKNVVPPGRNKSYIEIEVDGHNYKHVQLQTKKLTTKEKLDIVARFTKKKDGVKFGVNEFDNPEDLGVKYKDPQEKTLVISQCYDSYYGDGDDDYEWVDKSSLLDIVDRIREE